MMSNMSSLAGGGLEPKFGAEQMPARRDIITGLSRAEARISPKYFYDALGSRLFEAICQLDEYYLTRTEAVILQRQAEDIARVAGQGSTLIDLGAGNCEKAAGLFEMLQPELYVPIDISVDFLERAVAGLRLRYPALAMQPLGMDFSDSLTLPQTVQARSRKLFFYPGSSLGNFSPVEAAQFLARLRAQDGAVLLGLDLAKNAETLQAAYDDALGVTAAFNLNMLRHVNRILESDFDVRGWAHLAFFNAPQSRIEMHLKALEGVTVRWPGGMRYFAKGERIHTENSYKYSESAIRALLAESGFGEVTCWTDAGNNFLMCHARPI
jgi:dimethylhistidine N-methyltransferase